MNISDALRVVNNFISADVADPKIALGVFKKINSVLSVAPINEGVDADLLPASEETGDLDAQLDQMCKQMDEARAAKDWPTADAIREKIREMGFETRQTPEGTVIQKELA